MTAAVHLTVGAMIDYLKGLPPEMPVVVEAPMSSVATLFVNDLTIGHGENGTEDGELVISWEPGAASLVQPSLAIRVVGWIKARRQPAPQNF